MVMVLIVIVVIVTAVIVTVVIVTVVIVTVVIVTVVIVKVVTVVIVRIVIVMVAQPCSQLPFGVGYYVCLGPTGDANVASPAVFQPRYRRSNF